MPTGTPRHDLAREIAAADNWVFGDTSRPEIHRLARERARTFVGRFPPPFSHAKRG